MKQKRGMLLTEEVLKMVVAIIGLALLAYFLISFFSSDTKAKKQKEAAETIDKISQVLSHTVDSSEIDTIQPQRWTLFSFTNSEKKPNQCSGQNCVCICNKVIGDLFDRQIKKCSKEGSCLVISNLEEFQDIKIEPYDKGGTSILIQETGGKIQIIKK